MLNFREALKGFNDKYKKKITVVRFIFTAGLTLFDVISDLVLAVDYFINGDRWWGGLTLAFFILPFISGVFLLCLGIAKLCRNAEAYIHIGWIIWKVSECICEAGPQLILQLYIMALPAEPSLSDGQNTTGENILPKLITQHGIWLYMLRHCQHFSTKCILFINT